MPPFQLFLTEQEYFNKLNAKTIPTVCPLIFYIYFPNYLLITAQTSIDDKKVP